MQALTTTNLLAPNVAAEYGASCNQDVNGVYHIGNGVFGGFVPLIATWIGVWAAAEPAGTFAKEHSSLLGLVYPVTVALICFFIGSALMKDVRNVKLVDEQSVA